MRSIKGFTLIETLIAISILVVASIIIGSLFVSHSKLYVMQEQAGSMKIQKTLFAKHLQEKGGAAKSVIASRTFSSIPRTSSTSTVIFQIPAIDASGDIISGTYDYIVFYCESDNLFMETDADALSNRKDIKQKVAGKVDSVTFRYDNSVPASAKIVSGYLYMKSGTAEDEIGVSVYLRNK